MGLRRLAAVGLLVLSSLACGGEAPSAPAGPFNLILVSIDTLRADHVGAYGYRRPTTPNIDALARDAVLFEECIASAPTTLASHASILTSLLPLHHGASIARQTKLAEGIPTLAGVLRRHGFATASFNGGIQLDHVYGLDRGFALYESVKPHRADAEVLEGEENRLGAGVARARAWLRDVDRPFFLFLHSYEIHHPYTPDSGSLERFDAGYGGTLPDEISVDLLRQINAGQRTISQLDLRHIISAYDAELYSADAAVGELVKILKERGIYHDSMLILTSDHGEEFAEHGQVGWHHDTLYDELLRVPLIVKFPHEWSAGRVVKTQVRGIDVAPTALAALSIEAPERFSGVDLGRRIGDTMGGDLPAMSMSDTTHDQALWSLRQQGWKLHQWRGMRLFDLGRDPGETRDLAGEKPERIAEIRRTADRLLQARTQPEDALVRPGAEIEEQLRELGYVE